MEALNTYSVKQLKNIVVTHNASEKANIIKAYGKMKKPELVKAINKQIKQEHLMKILDALKIKRPASPPASPPSSPPPASPETIKIKVKKQPNKMETKLVEEMLMMMEEGGSKIAEKIRKSGMIDEMTAKQEEAIVEDFMKMIESQGKESTINVLYTKGTKKQDTKEFRKKMREELGLDKSETETKAKAKSPPKTTTKPKQKKEQKKTEKEQEKTEKEQEKDDKIDNAVSLFIDYMDEEHENDSAFFTVRWKGIFSHGSTSGKGKKWIDWLEDGIASQYSMGTHMEEEGYSSLSIDPKSPLSSRQKLEDLFRKTIKESMVRNKFPYRTDYEDLQSNVDNVMDDFYESNYEDIVKEIEMDTYSDYVEFEGGNQDED
jgi:hypothetical protein